MVESPASHSGRTQRSAPAWTGRPTTLPHLANIAQSCPPTPSSNSIARWSRLHSTATPSETF